MTNSLRPTPMESSWLAQPSSAPIGTQSESRHPRQCSFNSTSSSLFCRTVCGLGGHQTHVVDRLGDDGQGRWGEACSGKSSYFRNETSAGMDRFSSWMASTALSAMRLAHFRAYYLEKV